MWVSRGLAGLLSAPVVCAVGSIRPITAASRQLVPTWCGVAVPGSAGQSVWRLPRPRQRVASSRGGHRPVAVPSHPPQPAHAPWITIPAELWSKGWINVMSARAVLVYLFLVLAGRREEEGAHTPQWDRERFAIKEDTWAARSQRARAIGP